MTTVRSTRRAARISQARHDHDYGALEQRVSGMEQGIRDFRDETSGSLREITSSFKSSIAEVNIKLDRQQQVAIQTGKTNWIGLLGLAFGAVGTVTTIFVVIGSLAKTPIDNDLARIDAALVPRAELAADFKTIDRRLDKVEIVSDNAATRRETQRAEDKLREDIDKIRSDLVTRSEHKTHWDEIAERETALSNRITSMQHDFGSNYTLGDQLKSMQKQIDDMRLAEAAMARMPH